MGVTEVWFWEDGVLEINRLRENGYLISCTNQEKPLSPE